MCGIFGAASRYLATNERKIFAELGMVSVLRGADSTGVFALGGKEHKRPKLAFVKYATDPFNFFSSKQADDVINPPGNNEVRVLVGHNRLATVGVVNHQNAHPFNFTKVIGVHNGGVTKNWTNKSKEFDTDSETLYAQINERGITEVVKELGDGYTNAYALVYYDKEQRTLNMIRNTQRPLAIADCGGTIYWASEPDMLSWVVRRNSVSPTEIYMLKPFHLYTWRVGEGFNTKPTIADLTPVRPVYPSHNNYWQGARRPIIGGRSTTREPADTHDKYPKPGEVRVYDLEKKNWKTINWKFPKQAPVWDVLESELPLADGGASSGSAHSDCKPGSACSAGRNQVDDLCDDCSHKLVCTDRGCVRSHVDTRPAHELDAEERELARARYAPDPDEDEETLGDDELVEDLYKNIVTVKELREILKPGCGHCGTVYSPEDILQADGTIEGVIGSKNDRGGVDYTCEACHDIEIFGANHRRYH